MDLLNSTLVELAHSIRVKKISATEATQTYLNRIDALDLKIGAFHEIYSQDALRRARQVDDGLVRGPLAGVPLAIKDVLCTELGHTTCSSRMLDSFCAPFTATAVRRIEQAGAILLGKTNMDEFAMGSSCEFCAFGSVHNPWEPTHTPGGSSGGSAAAVAAGFCSAALGTDTGGSIRQPAAFCGVVGLKPTYGRVSRWGLVAYASSLDQIGPLTRSVKDAATLLKITAGYDPLDSTCARMSVDDDLDDVDQPVKDLRIGIAKQYVSNVNEGSVTAAIEQAIHIYRDAGAEVVEVDLPHTEYGIPAYYIVATAEASSNLARYDGVHYGHRTTQAEDLIDLYSRSRAEAFGPEVKRRIMLGTYALSSGYYEAYYLRALKARRLIKQDFDKAFDKSNNGCDAILCPTTTGPAFKIGQKIGDPLEMYLNDVYTVNANLAGIAGISLPAGFADIHGANLPVGVQLLGPAFQETTLLRIARLYESATDYHQRRPPL